MLDSREGTLQENGAQFDFNGGASLFKERGPGGGSTTTSAANTGGALCACSISRNAGEGITVRSCSIEFGFRLIPLFSSSRNIATHRSDEVVFQFSPPTESGVTELSYRIQDSALRASIVLGSQPAQDTLEWQLELDAHLQARLQSGGSVGVYGPHDVFSAPIQAGDSASAQTLQTARANAPCTQLLYTLPPFFVDGGDASSATRVPWQLEGDRLTLTLPEELISKGPVTLRSLLVVPNAASFFAGAQAAIPAHTSVSDTDADQATAEVAPAGSTGPWASTSSMNNYRAAFGVAVWNNYVYAVGGFGNSGSTLTVEFAQFDPDSGQLGPWQVAAGLTTHRGDVGVTAFNGYLYVVGGALMGPLASVEFAQINENGSLSSFTQTSVLSTARRSPGVAACNGYLYAVGGSDEEHRRLSSVEYAVINADGSLGAWQSTQSTNAFRSQPGVTVQNNYLYAVGGHDETGAEYAAIQEDGSLGEWITASTNLQFNYHAPGFAASDKYLYVIGGLNPGQATTTTTVEFAPIDKSTGAIGQWQTTSSKQTAVYDLAAVYWNGYVYALGGYINMAKKPIPWVEFAPVNGSGEVTAWQVSENELNTAMSDFGFAIWEGYLYAVGGCVEPGSFLATVQYARINVQDGSISAWKTSPNQLSGSRSGCGVAVWNGFIYVVGGVAMVKGDLATVEYARLDPDDGSVGAWTVSPNKLHYARSSHGVVACQGYLYVIGGTQLFAATIKSEYCQLNEDGSTGEWTLTTPLNQVRLGPAVAVSGNRIYVMGGGWTPGRTAPAIYAEVDASDGTLSDWKATGTQLPQQNNMGAAAVAWDGFLFAAGGQGYNPPAFDNVFSSQIQADGTLSPWTAVASLNTAREDFGLGVWDGYLYAVGGDKGTSDPMTVLGSVEIAEIG